MRGAGTTLLEWARMKNEDLAGSVLGKITNPMMRFLENHPQLPSEVVAGIRKSMD